MNPPTYTNSMEEHHRDDKVISKKELNKIQRKLNDHSKSLTKVFKISVEHGQHEKAKRNATVHVKGQLPVLKGNEKDHKSTIKMRPLMNTMDGPKKNISDNFSDILEAVVDDLDDGTLCSSSEELIESFENYNKSMKDKDNIKAS